MRIDFDEYKKRALAAGVRVSNQDIANATGLGIGTIEGISAGKYSQYRGEYIDAITTYFALILKVDVRDVCIVRAEPVTLPLALEIRPDRKNKKVGQKSSY